MPDPILPPTDGWPGEIPPTDASPRPQPDATGALHLAAEGTDTVSQPQMALRPTAPLPQIPGYELISVLGRGGMGVVYKARQMGLKRPVAIKMILAGGHASDEDRRRFRVEAEAIARLRHPNIVQVYEVGEADGHAYFAMEYVEGGSLARKLDWSPEAAARMVVTLAQAIHHAHDRGIVHRYLKPSNILLAADGVPRIADFGLAKTLDGASGQTQTGAILGTPGFMAPEQARGSSKAVGPAADVWALGAILYWLLTGRPPFQGETPFDTLMNVVTEEPVPPHEVRPGVSSGLEAICLRCLKKAVDRRFRSAADLATALDCYLDAQLRVSEAVPTSQVTPSPLARPQAVIPTFGRGTVRKGGPREYAVGDEPVPGYKLTRHVKDDEYGTLWVVNTPEGVEIAVKIINIQGQGLKELQTMGVVKELRHPNLIPIYAVGLMDEYGNFLDGTAPDSVNLRGLSVQLIIAMALRERSLAERLDECRRDFARRHRLPTDDDVAIDTHSKRLAGSDLAGIPFQELTGYLVGAARAIDYLNMRTHDFVSGSPQAILNCDIKPSNLLVVETDVQLCNYYLARVFGGANQALAVGTPAYIAPEALAGTPKCGTDQYSLAVSYYELRTGHLPFEKSVALHAHITGQLDFFLVSSVEQDILKRATHLRPTERYPNSEEFVLELLRAAVKYGISRRFT